VVEIQDGGGGGEVVVCGEEHVLLKYKVEIHSPFHALRASERRL
jgi:hypothetical protein